MGKYLKAVYGELPFDELNSIREAEIPKGDYYNYEKIRAVLLRKLKGEITNEYFLAWTTIVAWALNNEKYYDISWAFDGYSFQLDVNNKFILEMMAHLKDLDYKLRHSNYIEEHRRSELKVIYLRFEHCNWTANSAVYKAYFVDYKNRRFDIRFVDDAFFTYNDDLLYCYIPEVVQDNGIEEEILELRETPEEEQLMRYFYNEDEKWTYDHTINF